VGAFRDVLGGFPTLDVEKRPQGRTCLQQSASTYPGLGLTGTVLVQESSEPRLPRPPLSYPWALRLLNGPLTQCYPEERGAAVLHRAAARPDQACPLPYNVSSLPIMEKGE
jgi:hypothetical protein